MRWLNRVYCAVLLAGLASLSHAAEVQNMFEVTMPVTDQDQDTRATIFQQGFAEVLVRVSGNNQLPAINLSDAPSYVQQYRYLQLDKLVNIVPAKSDTPVPTHNLWVRYDEASVKKLLRSKGLMIWGAQRPTVLVWLAVRDGQNRYILRDQDSSPIRDAVNLEAARRGLPLIWPSYDDKDSKQFGFTDIWGGFFETVNRASQRYAASAVLIGRMDWQKKSGWQIDWSYMQDGTQQNWQQRATDLPVLMAAGINPVANQLASRFAVSETPAGVTSLDILVKGVEGAEAYSQVAQYLQSLALVKQMYATDITPGQAQFRLDINGNEQDLRRTIALNRTLSPEAMPEPSAVTPPAPVVLRYRLKL